MTRICADCYTCFDWPCKRKTVVGKHCPGHDPIPEPEPCERETGMLFVEE